MNETAWRRREIDALFTQLLDEIRDSEKYIHTIPDKHHAMIAHATLDPISETADAIRAKLSDTKETE